MNPFGSWRKCRDRKNHYFLDGKAICGSAATGKDEPERGHSGKRGRFKGPYRNHNHCKKCLAGIVEGWLKVGAMDRSERSK